MANELRVFENVEFGKVRTTEVNGQPYFVGKDVAEILGYTNPSKAIADHVDDEDKLNNETLSSLGQRGGWLINESGLYSLILTSKLPKAKEFKRWVTSEVLPSIRKTGQYVAKPMDSYMIDNPIERAKAWIKEEERRIALAEKVNVLEPLAGQTIKYIEKGHLIGMRALAQELKVNENKLRYVVDDVLGWRYKQGKYKVYKWAVTEGYMETKDSKAGYTHSYFTIKGRMRIEEELAKLPGNIGA